MTSAIKYMKLRIFDGIIDILNQAVDEMREYIEQNQLLQNQMQNYFEEIQTLQTSNIEAMYENKQLKNEIEEKDDLLFRYDEAYKKLNEVYQKNMTKLKQIMEENNKLSKEIKAKESIQHNIINENNILKLEIERKDRILNPLIEEKKRERKFQFLSAWEYGDLQKIKTLIENGCDIEAREEFGRTALMRASKNGQYEVVKYLISARR